MKLSNIMRPISLTTLLLAVLLSVQQCPVPLSSPLREVIAAEPLQRLEAMNGGKERR